MSIDTLIEERDEAEQQRDQAITERDAVRRRLAEAEARIGRLVAFADKVIDEYEEVHPAHVPPLTRTMRILYSGDLAPIAPDDADLRPGPSNPLVQTPHPWPLRRDDPEGEGADG